MTCLYSGTELNFPGVNYVYVQNGGLYNVKAHVSGRYSGKFIIKCKKITSGKK